MELEGISAVLRQLKVMEKSFANILMEAAVKLSHLSNSQMFILIETQDGRTFTGSPNLCEAFSTNGLYGQENDVQMHIGDAESASDHFQPESSNNKAGCTANLVACGWAGAVLEKVTGSSGQELYAQKAQKRRKSKKGTDQPTNGPT